MHDVLQFLKNRASLSVHGIAEVTDHEMVFFGADVSREKKNGILKKTERLAKNITCTGCENHCFEEVNYRENAKGQIKAFVACSSREDTSRVEFPVDSLVIWEYKSKMTDKKGKRCGDCEHFNHQNPEYGECRFNPPLTKPVHFPVLKVSDWCGKFSRVKEDELLPHP